MTITADPKLEIARLTALRDRLVALKNCGTGGGGFKPGNTCGREDGHSEGSQRRRAAGKKRKRRGPDRGVGPRTRAAQRKRAGRHNASRRKWREELMKPTGSPEGRQLYRSQAGERKDLADAFKAERKEQAKQKQADFKGAAKEIKSERKELAKDQHKERSAIKKEQAREIAKVDKESAKEHANLDAKYEAAKASGKNPEKLEQAYQERKREIDATHAEARGDLEAEHRQARVDMKLAQREDRSQAREEQRGRIEDIRKDHRAVANDQHNDQREQIHDLKSSHRIERAELKRDRRDEGENDKTFTFVDVKAAADVDGVPTGQAILDGVLAEMGHAEAWADGSLDDEQRRAVLEAVSVAGQAWLRGEAESLLEDVSTKALFGETRAKVNGFFKRAGKYIRELVTAGVLAVAGPGPANQTDAIVQTTQQQVAEQLKYLDKFKQQVISEEKPLTPEFAARAEQYGAAVWAISLEVERQGVIAADKASEVLRVLDENERHCPECPPLAELGWLKMKDAVRLGVVPLGKTVCRIRCRCYLRYR